MTRGHHIAAWILLAMAVGIVGAAWAGPDRLAQAAHADHAALQAAFSAPRVRQWLGVSAPARKVSVPDGGVSAARSPRSASLTGRAERLERTEGAAALAGSAGPGVRLLRRSLSAWPLQAERSVRLLRLLLLSAGLLSPVAIAAIADGLVQRRVHAVNLVGQSPVAFALAAHLFIAAALSPLVLVASPAHVPAWAVAACLCVAVVALRITVIQMPSLRAS